MSILGSYWEALGGSWEHLGRFLGLLGASWEHLGGLWGSSWVPLWLINVFKMLYVASYIMLKRSAYFSSGSTKSSSRRPPSGFLSASWGLLGVSWRHLGPSQSILEASWRSLGNHVGPLEALVAKMLIFHWFYKGLAAQLPRHVRQQHRGPEPWRGVGGRHPSPIEFRRGLVD